MTIAIRLAKRDEAATIAAVEERAGRAFDALDGYRWVDALQTMSEEEIGRGIAEDSVWVAQRDDAIVGAAVCFWRGEDCHLRELNVVPEAARMGIGRRLVETVVEAARERGCKRVVLTTFAEVSFNQPWYERLGFAPLDEASLTGWVADERASEKRKGLDQKPRVAMARATDDA